VIDVAPSREPPAAGEIKCSLSLSSIISTVFLAASWTSLPGPATPELIGNRFESWRDQGSGVNVAMIFEEQ